MTVNRLWLIVVVATVVLAIVIFFIIVFPALFTGLTNDNKLATIKDVATILAVIGLASVGIERFIEGIWNVVDISAGAFWPLNEVAGEVNDLVNALDQPLGPFFDQLKQRVVQGDATLKGLDKVSIQQKYNELNKYLDQLKMAATKSGSSQSIYTALAQKLRQMQGDHNIDANTINGVLGTIKLAADDLDTFIQSLKANPGRKVISLYLGSLLGLLVAWGLGLDLLATVLTTKHSLVIGIIVAGLVMGLGSSPAHEIVQAIQDYRKSLGKT